MRPTVLLSPDMKVQAYIKRVSTGEETPVDKDGFVIGKSVEADFVVKNNPTVSRKHVKIHIRPDGYWLEDLAHQPCLCKRRADHKTSETDTRYEVYPVTG